MICMARSKTPKWAVSPPEINLRGRTAHLGEAKASVERCCRRNVEDRRRGKLPGVLGSASRTAEGVVARLRHPRCRRLDELCTRC